MKLKPPAETFDFKRKFIEQAKVLSGRKYAEAHLIFYHILLSMKLDNFLYSISNYSGGGMMMLKVLYLILIAVGGYYLVQKRFRLLNFILGNSMVRRFFVSSLMNIPAIRNRITGIVFPQNPYAFK